MADEDITPKDSLPQGEDVTPGDGEGAASDEVVSVKDTLSKVLGKNFDSDEQALKSVKDTYSYVGKAGQDVKELQGKLAELAGVKGEETEGQPDKTASIEEKVQSLEQQLNEAQFYAENPEYNDYKGIISKLGDKPAEVIGTEEFKSVYEKAKAYDEQEQSKSVLQSNPRLGKVTDKMTEAREAISASKKAMTEGDLGASIAEMDKASTSATDAVIDAFEIGQ